MVNDLNALEPSDYAGSSYNDVADGDYSGLVQFHPGADEAVAAGQAFAEGDWAGGVISLAGSGAELASLVLDPIATLASSVAGFLLDYMPPLPQMLDALAGNPDVVEAIAQTWENVAVEFEAIAGELNGEINQALLSWSGKAADAFEAAAFARLDAAYSAAHCYRCIGNGMDLAAGVVDAVRGLTKEIIAELVGALISWAAQVGFTFGIGATWVIPQATARIADTTTDCVRLSDALVDSMRLGTTAGEVVVNSIGRLNDAYDALDAILG